MDCCPGGWVIVAWAACGAVPSTIPPHPGLLTMQGGRRGWRERGPFSSQCEVRAPKLPVASAAWLLGARLGVSDDSNWMTALALVNHVLSSWENTKRGLRLKKKSKAPRMCKWRLENSLSQSAPKQAKAADDGAGSFGLWLLKHTMDPAAQGLVNGYFSQPDSCPIVRLNFPILPWPSNRQSLQPGR